MPNITLPVAELGGKVLNELYEEAKAVGLDIKWRKHYHPRMIKDVKGFVEHFYKREDWSVFDDAINAKARELGRDLTIDEKAYVINSMIRGFSQSHINLSRPGNLKERGIELVTPDPVSIHAPA